MKQFIKSLIPPLLLEELKKLQNLKYGWKGDYTTWQEAQDASTGYDDDKILQTVKSSLLKVKNGEAIYERDSVIFDKIQYSWPLLSGLMFVAAKFGGVLKILDFGGSLGSTYYQNKKFLDEIDSVTWSIVEQKHFVETGKKEFEDDRLKFFYSVEECIENEKPDILLLSSVLQYIENPYELLDTILKNDFKFVLMDLTAVSVGSERLTIQIVPPSIYEATYPCWMLDEVKLDDVFNKNGFTSIEKYESLNGYEVIVDGKKMGKYIGEIRKKYD